MSKKLFYYLGFFILIVLVFKSWFFGNLITGGDFWPYYKSMYSLYSFPLQAWSTNLGNGLGGFAAPLLWIFFNVSIPLTILGNFIGLPWNTIERLYYLLPLLALSFFSSFHLYKNIIAKNNYALLASFIFIFNTYFLMLSGGGQIIGVGLAYAIMPLSISLYIGISRLKKVNIQRLLALGLILAMQEIFDIRILYITIFSCFLYFLVSKQFINTKKYLIFLAIPFLILIIVNFFWILPTIIVHQNPIDNLGSAYNSKEAVKFFSFARLENSISLLHPNWPENIFGKVGFMRPEFLFIPILAFLSLLFVEKESKERRLNILYFALLGLIGAFLAKGAQEPFGGLYIWLFEKFPGFLMFRDPTKWYTLIAISYSILIPYSTFKIYELLNSKIKTPSKSAGGQKSKLQFKIKNYIPNLFLLFVICYLLFLIRPALLGQLGGTFRSTTVPMDYIKLEQLLSSDKKFYRTLWVPQIQRFAFFSNNHPAIAANDLFKVNSPEKDINFLENKSAPELLKNSSVKYIIVPYDTMGEIFLNDRKYDDKLYNKTIKSIDSIPYLREIKGFEKIKVYEVPSPKDHFWSNGPNLKISYNSISPTMYQVTLKGARKGDSLIFSENFDKGWVFESSKSKIQSSKFTGKFNSFTLPKNGDYIVEIYYEPQRWVDLGVIISLTSLGMILICLTYLGFKKQFSNKRL